MRVASIYTLSDPRTGAVRYCGKTTKRPETRRREHVSEARKGGHNYRLCWIRSLLAEGVEPAVSVVRTCAPEEAGDLERAVIAELLAAGVRLTNGTAGGDGMLGYRHTEEAKAAIAAARSGPKTPEHLEAIRQALLGRQPPAAAIEGVRRYNATRPPLSDESRERLRAGCRARPPKVWTQEARDKVAASMRALRQRQREASA